jgi:peptide/nickel transport system permease protein
MTDPGRAAPADRLPGEQLPGDQLPPGRRAGASALRTFAGHRLGVAGLGLIVALVLFCFLGPLIYHSDQIHANIQLTNMPPGRGHPLGTDSNGYDILGRLMTGGRASLAIGLAVAAVATAIGVAWGAIAGFTGGLADAVMMRVVDVVLAIPAIFLLI